MSKTFCADKIVLGSDTSGVYGSIQERASAFPFLETGRYIIRKFNLEKNKLIGLGGVLND